MMCFPCGAVAQEAAAKANAAVAIRIRAPPLPDPSTAAVTRQGRARWVRESRPTSPSLKPAEVMRMGLLAALSPLYFDRQEQCGHAGTQTARDAPFASRQLA